MNPDDGFALRALLLLLGVVLVGAPLAGLRRRLQPGVRLALDFALGLYALTFYIGVVALFLWQDPLVDLYFDGMYPAPVGTPYGALLLLATTPLLVLPGLLALAQGLRATPAPAPAPAPPPAGQRPPVAPIEPIALLLGVGISLAVVWLLTGALLPTLVDNALSDLGQTAGLAELYARRREVFEDLSALRAGMLYGTLPACAALLLFVPRGPAWPMRALGLALAGLVVVVNAGLFQIAPMLAFGLMLLLCAIVRLPGRIHAVHLAAVAVLGGALFGAYQSLKDDPDTSSNPAVQLALRLPVALPYLWEFSTQAPAELALSDSLPHDLGEFMFPELRSPERFVAMPQPGFVESFFRQGLLPALAVLGALALMALLGGESLDRLHRRGDPQRAVLVAVLLSPALYYGFQVQLRDVFVSSYGVIFPALPVLAVLAAHALLRLRDPEPLSEPEPGPLPP